MEVITYLKAPQDADAHFTGGRPGGKIHIAQDGFRTPLCGTQVILGYSRRMNLIRCDTVDICIRCAKMAQAGYGFKVVSE